MHTIIQFVVFCLKANPIGPLRPLTADSPTGYLHKQVSIVISQRADGVASLSQAHIVSLGLLEAVDAALGRIRLHSVENHIPSFLERRWNRRLRMSCSDLGIVLFSLGNDQFELLLDRHLRLSHFQVPDSMLWLVVNELFL